MLSSHKTALRQQLFARRKALGVDVQQQYSAQIMAQALAYLQQQQAQSVLLYRSVGSEVITTAWHEAHSVPWRVYAPVCHEACEMTWFDAHSSDWQAAGHGLLEPIGGERWQAGDGDWLLCPLLGFNRQGHRIGMGKGYFDRWLAANRSSIRGCLGLAFSCQEVADLPVEAHDEPLDGIITEKGFIRV
jgi:5-formyltetrahydrofolate cyclo-ligase